MMGAAKFIVLFWCLFFGVSAMAEVYRWVDAQGKVHYSDKQPAASEQAVPAQDVTQKVSKQNIDSGTEERRKVSAVLRKENDADRVHAQKLEFQAQQLRLKRCEAARKRLKDISGHVIFLDAQKKVVPVTEQERQQKIAEVNEIIKANCR